MDYAKVVATIEGVADNVESVLNDGIHDEIESAGKQNSEMEE